MEVKVQTATKQLTNRAADDLILVNSAKNGCQKSYSQLLHRYENSVYRTMYGMVNNSEDAQDLTQEAFGKAFNKLPTYVPHHAFSTWLFRIAKNNCIDHIRKKRLHTLSIDEPVEHGSECDFSNNLKAPARTPEQEVMRREKIEMVRQCVQKLGEKYKRMIELRFYEEYSYEEIASELGIPLGTVKAQLFRAKDLVFEIMQPGAKSYMEDTVRHSKKKKAKARKQQKETSESVMLKASENEQTAAEPDFNSPAIDVEFEKAVLAQAC